MVSVLFVDDEINFLKSLERLFKIYPVSWQYMFAETASEARKLIDKGSIDVVITDLMMPEIDGFKLLDSIRTNPRTKYMPVIMLTGKGGEELAVEAMHHGAADYLVKDSITPEGLERAILNALEKSNLRQRAERYSRKLRQKVMQLEESHARVNMLEGLLPICMHCKDIRSKENDWQQIETYIEEHSEATFSHSLCPDCKEKHYGEFENNRETISP